MKCEQAREQLPDFLAGGLDDNSKRELEEHLAACPWCGEEAAMWARLGALEEEQPAPELRARFDAMLSAYREGLEHGAPRRSRFSAWLESWWPAQPAFQFSIAAGMLGIGLAAGRLLAPGAARSPEIAKLQEEVHNTRELVTLSLLQQQSASERLRGVSWSYRVQHPDREVLAALLQTLNYDVSVDVRLAAVDALRRFSQDEAVRAGMLAALGRQPSPMVQIALIDAMVEMRAREASGALRQLQANRAANEAVRQRAGWALEQLK